MAKSPAYGQEGKFFPTPKDVDFGMPASYFKRRLGGLKPERQEMEGEWQEITDFINPRRGRYLVSDINKSRTSKKIINNTATLSRRTLMAGMMSGASSPARPWFRMTTPTPDLAEQDDVKIWLYRATQMLNLIFAKSNFYGILQTAYGDLGDFGNAAGVIDENFDSVIHGTIFATGEYYMGLGADNRIDTIYREFSMRVGAIVQQFGYERVSKNVKSLYDKGNYDQQIPLVHVIEPNRAYDKFGRGFSGMPFVCGYFETAGDEEELLSLKGYHEWPGFAARWDAMNGDTWGNGCGLDAISDVKALQILEKEKAIAIQKQNKPSLQGPTQLMNRTISHQPGMVTYVDTNQNNPGLRPIYEVRTNIQALGLEIQAHENRIKRAYYEDLFLMLAGGNGGVQPITAREVQERHEEKLIALGPVLERLHDELLNKVVNRAFQIAYRAKLIPEPPAAIAGIDLKIEYISVLAAAQKAVSIGSIERFMGFVGAIGGTNPEAFDKFDSDQAIDEYADAISVTPSVVRGDKAVEKMRNERKQQMAQAAAQAQTAEAVNAAKTLSETNVTDPSLLSSIVSGTGTPVQ